MHDLQERTTRARLVIACFAWIVIGCSSITSISKAQTIQGSYVVANGGQEVRGNNITLHSTVGQALVGATSTQSLLHGAGFWYTESLDVILQPVSVEDSRTSTDQPQTFSLDQNYPNPFNPSTNISYAVATPGPVSIVIYDLLGREVQMLVDEHHATGTYELSFDAEDLPSGMYLYVFSYGSSSITRHMILLK